MDEFQKIKEDCCEANKALPKLGLVDMTFGNVSVLDRAKGIFAIKPSGVDYDDLTPDDMVLVGIDGNKVAGELNPSSDTATHACLFRNFPECNAVVHTHSRNATAFAQAKKAIRCYGTTHSDFFYGEIPVTRPMTDEEIKGEYELETGNIIVERFKDIDAAQVPAVLVSSHGPFAWGPNAKKAVENAQAMEICAQMAAMTEQLTPSIETVNPVLLDKHFLRKHGKNAYYGQKK